MKGTAQIIAEIRQIAMPSGARQKMLVYRCLVTAYRHLYYSEISIFEHRVGVFQGLAESLPKAYLIFSIPWMRLLHHLDIRK